MKGVRHVLSQSVGAGKSTRASVGTVSWLPHRLGFLVFINRATDNEYETFQEALKNWCLGPDGQKRELTDEEVAREKANSEQFRARRELREEEYLSSSVGAANHLAQMLAQRKPSKSRRKSENRLSRVVAQGGALAAKKIKLGEKTLEEAVQEDEESDSSIDAGEDQGVGALTSRVA